MHEHQTISKFNSRILTMVNDYLTFGKPISEEEICRKILRSAHPRYHLKILAIEEYDDMSTMTRDSLIGKLMVYETKAPFGIAFGRVKSDFKNLKANFGVW